MSQSEMSRTPIDRDGSQSPIIVPHVIKGRVQFGSDVVHLSRDLGADFATPALDLDGLVWQRSEPGPLFDTPVAEIIDFLVELGDRLDLETNPLLQEALDGMAKVSELSHRILTNCYGDMRSMFARDELMAEVVESLGGVDVIDGWKEVGDAGVRSHRIRAFPPRLVHIMAGNSPMVTAISVIRGALCKGVNLLKMPSNDLFTASAILRTMADIDPDHPVTRSFSTAYWKGGDEKVESVLYRAQYFDKIVVWGGESAVRHAQKYSGLGLELISYDPKVSVSMIGRETFASEETLQEVARRGAYDVLHFNQDACDASRYQFIEGTAQEADRYAGLLAEALAVDVRYGEGTYKPTPENIRSEVEILKMLEPLYAVFGSYDGKGLVIRSDSPVDFHPDVKTVNVVPVDQMEDALKYVTVATQTVGIWPASRRKELRDALASAGAQHINTLGDTSGTRGFGGMPHDGSIALHRFVKWIVDDGAET